MKPTTFALLAAALAASASWAGEHSIVPAQTLTTVEAATKAEAAPEIQSNTSSRARMKQEIDLAWAGAQEEVALLTAESLAASPTDRRELERRAVARKVAAFAEVYSIQARFARADDRVQDAEALEAIVAQIMNPAVPVTPHSSTTRSLVK